MHKHEICSISGVSIFRIQRRSGHREAHSRMKPNMHVSKGFRSLEPLIPAILSCSPRALHNFVSLPTSLIAKMCIRGLIPAWASSSIKGRLFSKKSNMGIALLGKQDLLVPETS